MSYLLEILGRGLLAELAAAFRKTLRDDAQFSTHVLEARVESNPSDLGHHRALGIRYLTESQYARASSAFEKALAVDRTDRVSQVGAACALDELGMTAAATERLRLLLRAGMDDAPTWFALGFCCEKLGELDEAIAAYQTALTLPPPLRNACERLAAIHLKRDEWDQAIQQYEHLCVCEPDDLPAGLTLANLLFHAKRFKEAVQQYEHVIAIEPDNWEARDELAAAYIEEGRYDEAVDVLTDLIERRPECADPHVQLGDLCTKLGRHEHALASYTQAVELNPDYLEANVKVGVTHLRGGLYKEAAQAFNRAVEINDRLVNAYVGLSVAQQALGKEDEAKQSLQIASGLEPNGTVLFGELARLQLKVTAAEQNERYLSPKAVTLSPNGPPEPKVSDVVGQQIANLRSALRRHPNHADVHYRLGLLLRFDKDLVGAIASFRRAVAINPQYLKALTRLALALYEAGRPHEARDVLQQALDMDPKSVELHYELGLMFAAQGEFSRALDSFEYAAAKQPATLDHVANVALALQNMGLIDRAEAAWCTLCEVARETKQASRILDR